MPANAGRKICRQFWGRIYAGNFGSENMPAISDRKICQRFRVGKYAGNFGSEDMPAVSGPKICRRFRVEKKMPPMSDRNKMANSAHKNADVFWGGFLGGRRRIKLRENLQVCNKTFKIKLYWMFRNSFKDSLRQIFFQPTAGKCLITREFTTCRKE